MEKGRDGKRTLAAIVFTDAVGFSALAHEDEASALEAIGEDHDRMRQICREHEGEVVKSTGDGLLMMFDSAVSAFLCALAILREVAGNPLQHRIGLHLGDVTVSGEDVMGDGVNVASRLQEMARPGELCASQTVVDVVQSRLKFASRPLGEQTLKNIPHPMRVYAIDPFSTDSPRASHWRLPPARAVGVVATVLGVLVIGIPLWMVALRPPVVQPAPASVPTGLTLSPELAQFLRQASEPAAEPETAASEAPSIQDREPVKALASGDAELAKKLKDLEEMNKWFASRLKTYSEKKPLTVPDERGKGATQLWADVDGEIVVKKSDNQTEKGIQAETFVRAMRHMLDRTPPGPEREALQERLASITVPRKSLSPPKAEGSPTPTTRVRPSSNLATAVQPLPLPREVHVKLEELDKLNDWLALRMKTFGPDNPLDLPIPDGGSLKVWMDKDGDLVGKAGESSAALVEKATYIRAIQKLIQEAPAGKEREAAQKVLESLFRKRETAPPPPPEGDPQDPASDSQGL